MITSVRCGPGTGRFSREFTETMAADCRARGVPIIWVLVPRVGRPSDWADQRALSWRREPPGFTRIVDVTDAYDGRRSGPAGRRAGRLSSQRAWLTTGWPGGSIERCGELPELRTALDAGPRPCQAA